MCDTAQFLLDAKSDYFYEPRDAEADADGRKRYVSIKDQTNTIIGEFPKEGRQFYQVSFGPTADALLKDAAADGYDKGKLADVSQRYFHHAGRRAGDAPARHPEPRSRPLPRGRLRVRPAASPGRTPTTCSRRGRC